MSVTSHFNFFGDCSTVSKFPPTLTSTDPPQELGTGPYEDYPIKMSLFKCMRMFWGVKKWKMSFDWEYEILTDKVNNPDFSTDYEVGSYVKGSGSVSGVTGDVNNTSFNYIHSAEKELDLLCRNEEPEFASFAENWIFPITFERRIIINEGTEEEPNLVTTDDTFESYAGFGIGAGEIGEEGFASRFSRKEDNSLNELWVLLSAFVEFGGVYGRNFRTPAQTIEDSIVADFNFLGENITLNLGGFEREEDFIIKSEISNVVIEPYEWWTYGGKYDSETGEEV